MHNAEHQLSDYSGIWTSDLVVTGLWHMTTELFALQGELSFLKFGRLKLLEKCPEPGTIEIFSVFFYPIFYISKQLLVG